MTGLYAAGLLVAIAGLTVLDLRLRLFLGADPVRAAIVLVIGVAGFLAWDAAGVHLGIFFEGRQHLLLGVDLGRDIPVEEVLFLVVLCLSAMEAFGLGRRLLTRGRRPSAGDR